MSRLLYVEAGELYTSNPGVRESKIENLKKDILKVGVDGIGIPIVTSLYNTNDVFTGNYFLKDGLTKSYLFCVLYRNPGIWCKLSGVSHENIEGLQKLDDLDIIKDLSGPSLGEILKNQIIRINNKIRTK
jgi:hypothetical protein